MPPSTPGASPSERPNHARFALRNSSASTRTVVPQRAARARSEAIRCASRNRIGRRRSLFCAVLEESDAIELRAFDPALEIFHVLVGLAGKTDDKGRAHRDSR